MATGVNGVTGFVISQPEAPPFEVHGGPVDPYHSNRGEKAHPYPWEVIPMGPYPKIIGPGNDRIGIPPQSLVAGRLYQDPTADQTPSNDHAAPFLKEGPTLYSADQMDSANRNTGSARQLLESLRLHAINTGASLRRLFAPTQYAKQDKWSAFFNPETGNDIVPHIPGSVSANAGGFGANDHVSNAYAKVNRYDFNTSHRHRRFATGPIPGNFMYLKPGGRPMVRNLTGNYNFPTSGAFAGDDPGATFSYDTGAILQNMPTEYTAPPQINLQPTPIPDTSGETVPTIPWY